MGNRAAKAVPAPPHGLYRHSTIDGNKMITTEVFHNEYKGRNSKHYIYRRTTSLVQALVVSGEIKWSTYEVDVTEYYFESKSIFADDIVDGLKQYLSTEGKFQRDLKTIKNFDPWKE